MSLPARTLLVGIARCAVLLASTLAGAMALVTWVGGGTYWAIELMRFVPYPAFLVPAVLAVALSWWLGRAWRVVALVALALVVGPVMGWRFARPDTGFDKVRMMTFNIKSYLARERFGGYADIAEEIERHSPDLLVMQDAQILVSRPSSDAGKVMERALHGRALFMSGEYVVASRFPMRDCHAEDMSFGRHEREYIRCTVRVHGIDIDLVTAHFVSPREGLNAARHERLAGLDDWQENFENRVEQSRRLARGVTRRVRPIIVAGDLNAAESSPIVRALLGTGMRDAFSAGGTGYGYTHGHSLRLGFSFLRIDHILVSADIGVQSSFVGGSTASDHRPVIADLWMNRTNFQASEP